VHPQSITPLRLVETRKLRQGVPTSPEKCRLRLLPSGPDRVHSSSPSRTLPSTPRGSNSPTASDLMEEFNPAKAGCGLQGTASSPSSTTAASLPFSVWPVKRDQLDLGQAHRHGCLDVDDIQEVGTERDESHSIVGVGSHPVYPRLSALSVSLRPNTPEYFA